MLNHLQNAIFGGYVNSLEGICYEDASDGSWKTNPSMQMSEDFVMRSFSVFHTPQKQDDDDHGNFKSSVVHVKQFINYVKLQHFMKKQQITSCQ